MRESENILGGNGISPLEFILRIGNEVCECCDAERFCSVLVMPLNSLQKIKRRLKKTVFNFFSFSGATVVVIVATFSFSLISASAHAINTEKYFPVKLGAVSEFEAKQVDNSPYTSEPPPYRYSEAIEVMEDPASSDFKITTTRPNASSFIIHRLPKKSVQGNNGFGKCRLKWL